MEGENERRRLSIFCARAPTRSSKIASIESRLFFAPYTRRAEASAGDASSAAVDDADAANGDADEDDDDDDEDASTDSGVDLIADLTADLTADWTPDLTADFAADLAADLVPMKPPVAAGVWALGV